MGGWTPEAEQNPGFTSFLAYFGTSASLVVVMHDYQCFEGVNVVASRRLCCFLAFITLVLAKASNP